MGAATLSLGAKWLGRDAEHSLPSSAEVKNEWRYTSTPQYVFMSWCLIKQWARLHGVCHHSIVNYASRGVVVSTPAFHLEGPWFESQPGDRLS
jgi:hypothetical protein